MTCIKNPLNKIKVLLFLFFFLGTCFAKTTVILEEKNTLFFYDDINESSTSTLKNLLKEMDLSLTEEKEEIYVVLDSPGGDAIELLDLINFIPSLDHKINFIVKKAASAAFVLVQATTGKRYIVETGIMMQHSIKNKDSEANSLEELRDKVKFIEGIEDVLMDIMSSRIGKSKEELLRLTHAGKEWYLLGKHAVRENVADEVVSIRCSKAFSQKKVSLTVKSKRRSIFDEIMPPQDNVIEDISACRI